MSPRDAAATHAPPAPLPPNVGATLAPGSKIEARHNAEPPRPAPAATFSRSIPDAPSDPLNGANGHVAKPVATTGTSPSPAIAEKKPVTLRARKVGEKPARLDVRIKYAQARKIRAAMKVAAKSRTAPPPAKAAAQRKGIAKAARRIGFKINGATRLLPAKAATKIVGAPQTAPRVRVAPAP
jgi:hypothetical protein